ncbi:RNA polymerase sigma factor [Pyxidicoccus xibeiensis]|uniref:RNA polymerase sigma factor n=1 Tax=Pyxidicoccus xibeiensis TaxID=2906759 RepID=UPI0020A757A2|nr:sigma-70 family RNA polymerase sigma factor [Pyxidicoccus xibeiensis]MCP3138135.1 sigma-70 family RNA polymerase sigma factor [Pyxidicoccus xibeiensis]
MALVIFAFNVLIPIEGLAFFMTALTGFFGAAYLLERLGALSSGIFDGAVYLASALLLLGAMLAASVTAWNLIRRLAGQTKPPPLLLRWPWLVVGVILALACRAILPPDLGRSQQPVLAGALVLAAFTWAVLYSAYLLYALGWGGLSLSWRIARTSPFGAGMLTLACLGSTAFVFLLGALADELESSAGRLSAPRASASCNSPSVECSRQLLLASATMGATPSLSSGPSRTQSFRDCMESRYQDHTLLAKARSIAAEIVGPADAPDIVYESLLSVCLHSDRYRDFEQFFLRSVRNRALNGLRSARSCPIDLEPEPSCTLRPDDDYVRRETQLALQKSLCALGAEHRQVLLMHYFDDMSELEISQQLGIEYAAARKRVQRARDKLEIDFLQRCR